FATEGVDTHFTLMGDGNMHWASAMKNLDGMGTFSARHEHCACAMAMGYHLATGKVGVASVTCGPGFTQIMTALTVAARGRVPLVVFAGEAPMNAKWYNQALEQPPLAAATGAPPPPRAARPPLHLGPPPPGIVPMCAGALPRPPPRAQAGRPRRSL